MAQNETQFGTFEELLDGVDEQLCKIASELKLLILNVDPDAVEVVRLGDNAATYGVGPKKMSEGYCYIMPHKKWVNLGFYKGASLEDPDELLEGSGKQLRHIKVKDFEMATHPAVRKMVEKAVAERKQAVGGK